MRLLSLLSFLAFGLLVLLLPLVFGQLMIASLGRLHLSPAAALALMIAIILGGMVNIPVKRLAREQRVDAHPLDVFGLAGALPRWRRVRHETVIAVNLGGCVIPTGLALYELFHLAAAGGSVLLGAGMACAGTVAICYGLARPVAGIGIVMPGLVPALAAASFALLLVPGAAAPVAFVAGVAGPLIGADLLHLRQIEAIAVGTASIGGAGTFDGIVLSGIIAAYLA